MLYSPFSKLGKRTLPLVKTFKTHVVPVMYLKGKPKEESNITLSTAYCTCGADTILAPHSKTMEWARKHSKQHKDMT